MTFFPKDYRLPTKSNYLKLQQGENTFRILSSAITGWEYWNDQDKPVRSRLIPQTTPTDLKKDPTGKPTSLKHFWAFVVWNYDMQAIQIYEVTQSSIQVAIAALVNNTKWGDPKGYDITITKVGEKLETKYAVMPSPHTPISQEVLKKAMATPIKLEALFDGQDPFTQVSETEPTPAQEIKEKVKAAGWDRKLSNEIDIGQQIPEVPAPVEEQIDLTQIPF